LPPETNIAQVSVASLRGFGGQTTPGDTLQAVTPERKKIFFMGEFAKNSGHTRLDRWKSCGV